MSEPKLQNVLALDTSSSTLRMVLMFGADRTVSLNEEVGASHGQMLVRKIQDLLSGAGLASSQLHALVVCTGPGSFTGLRIGLSAVKGMAEALDIPVVGVSLFEVAAFKLHHVERPVCVVLPFKRDECFVAEVSGGRFEPSSIKPVPFDRLRDFLGDRPVTAIGLDPASETASDPTVPQRTDYDAADLLHVGLTRLRSGESDDIARLEPLYVQKSQAELRYERRRKER